MTRTKTWLCVVALGLAIAPGARSESSLRQLDDDGGRGTHEPEPETIAVEDLPPAGGRTAFAISDEAAIAGGGQIPKNAEHVHGPYPPISVPPDDLQFERALDVWMLGPDGRATNLPPLPADGTVSDLSGTQVDKTLVLAGRSQRRGAGHLVVWTMGPGDDDWTEHVLADAAMVDGPGSGTAEPEVVSTFDWSTTGTRDGGTQALLAITNGGDDWGTPTRGGEETRTRYLTFDPAHGRFDALGDGERTLDSQYCLDEWRGFYRIFEIRHVKGYRRYDGNPLTEVSVAGLSLIGWSEETPVDLSAIEGVGAVRRVRNATLQCPAGRGPLLLLTVETDTGDTATALMSLDVEPPSEGSLGVRIVTYAVESFTEALQTLDEDVVSARLVGSTPSGEVIVNVSSDDTSDLYTFAKGDGLLPIEGFDHVAHDTPVFAYGDRIGTVGVPAWGAIRLTER